MFDKFLHLINDGHSDFLLFAIVVVVSCLNEKLNEGIQI